MITRCEKQHKTQLLNYLKDEAVYNTFMLADIPIARVKYFLKPNKYKVIFHV